MDFFLFLQTDGSFYFLLQWNKPLAEGRAFHLPSFTLPFQSILFLGGITRGQYVSPTSKDKGEYRSNFEHVVSKLIG